MITLIAAAVSGSLVVILSKITLTGRHVSVHVFTPLIFLFLFLITAVLVPWLGRFDFAAALKPTPFLAAAVVVIIAAIWNVFQDRAIKNETVQEFEGFILLVPLLTMVLSGLFFDIASTSPRVFVSVLVASAALVIGHFEKHKIIFNRNSRWLLLAVLLMAIENNLQNYLLEIWSPTALYFVRTFFVFVLLMVAAKPTFDHLSVKSIWLTFAAALAGVAHMIAKFYGYQTVGIAYTTLVLVLEPVFTFTFDKIILREKIQPRYLVATIIILSAVVYGSLVR